MADWQARLELGDVYRAGKSIPELASIVARRLAALPLPSIASSLIRFRRSNIVSEFERISANPDSDADDFDEIMETLYDWADSSLDDRWNGKKLCWVDTFTQNALAESSS